ncbi:MAG: ATP-binding protein [Thaumarchaeota archaeon]|nr:ATP-binding protein [Nitrososphaerota archaeon]MCL5317804.1 ATP-binding protein [Nitrososphaerota archaeon]
MRYNLQDDVLDQVMDAVITVDNESNITYLNKSAAKQYTVDAKSALGSKLTDLYKITWLKPADEPNFRASLEKFGHWHGENIHRLKDSGEIHVESTVTVLKDASGEKIGLLNIHRNITRCKIAENELQKSEKHLSIIQRAAGVGAWDWNVAENTIAWSPETYTIYGLDPNTPVSYEQALSLIHPEDRSRITNLLNELQIHHSKIWKVEYRIAHRSLGMRWLLNWGKVVYNSEGKIIRIVGVSFDITERKNIEDSLKHRIEDLQTLVDERTEQLREAERLAVIGETAGMVGHDLRNPLQSIVITVYLAEEELSSLAEGKAKTNLQQFLETINEQVNYINKIVSDLQDYAEPLVLRSEETDLGQAITDSVRAITLPENIQQSIRIEDNFPKMTIDPFLIKRVLINLITNAVQAMPNGGKLKISASRKKGNVLINVEDTGVGIPDEHKPHLFKPLFTTKSKGQGFGLAASKRIVESYNGSITVESEVGKGAKFTIHLPLTKR